MNDGGASAGAGPWSHHCDAGFRLAAGPKSGLLILSVLGIARERRVSADAMIFLKLIAVRRSRRPDRD
jgi:hypothetical protein